ncbi:MAG: hypothetical protein ACPGU1_17740 [Myxococcota bacterium]
MAPVTHATEWTPLDPIEDSPVFHWFVVVILCACLWFSLDGPWWAQAAVGFFLLRVLSWHTAFTTRTTVKPAERIIEMVQLTPIGRRRIALGFDAISEVRIQTKAWGDYNSRQLRGTLMLCTLNRRFNVIYSSRDARRLTQLADELRDAIGLLPSFKEVPPLESPKALTEAQVEALQLLCQDAIDSDRILGPDDVSDELRETIATHTGMPTTEALWCFVDTAMALKGRYGLAIGAHGLYWANDKDLKEHTKISRLSWDDIGAHTFAVDPADSDIMVGTTSQIGSGVFWGHERILTLLCALQEIVTSRRECPEEAGDDATDERDTPPWLA